MQLNISILTIPFLALLMSACHTTQKAIPYQRNGMVEFVNGVDNTVTVVSTSTAATENQAVYYAEINALENILFRGIPGSNQANPMIEKEPSQTNEALSQLLEKQGYKRFMTRSYLVNKSGNKQAVTVQQEVTFDLQALRKHLESTGLVRKFGL